MREKYESLALAELREIAKARGMKRISGLKKAELIEQMLQEDEKDKEAGKDVEPKPVLRGMREPSFVTSSNNSGERANRYERREKPARAQNGDGAERPAPVREQRPVPEGTENRQSDEKFPSELTAASQRGGSWRSCRMVLGLSGARTSCPAKMTCMWRRARYAVSG